jgi:hypothetical protein
MAAMRIDSIWNVTQNPKLAQGSKGDVQILTASIKGQKSIRLVNVYSQKVFNGGGRTTSGVSFMGQNNY